MRVAQVAPLWTPVPPEEYGGAELMVHWLTEELVRIGHEVTLFASGDSRTSAALEPTVEVNLIDLMARGGAYQYEPYATSALAAALSRARDFDIIHSHLGAFAIPLSRCSTTPLLHTVHAGLDSVDELWVLRRHPEALLAALSRSQIATLPEDRRRLIRVIYHGCDFGRYGLSEATDGRLVFLGRMGPHKNPVDAIRLARAVDMPIVLAGKPQTKDEARYFSAEVQPLLDQPGVTYLGAIPQSQKVELLQSAAALVFPIRWEEHFGLVMIEAMACGTPVLAYQRGSVAEVIDPGRTGFYGGTLEDLRELAPQALALNRRTVREHAQERFSHRRMVSEYLDLYRSTLERSAP